MMSTECVFCRIVAQAAPASIVHADDTVVAFMDILPVNPGHTLVVPRVHTTGLGDMLEEAGAQLMRVAQRIAGAIQQGPLQAEGINLFLADGEAAGQEVFHTHLHIIPRFDQDGLTLAVDYEPPPDRSLLDQHAATIAAVLHR